MGISIAKMCVIKATVVSPARRCEECQRQTDRQALYVEDLEAAQQRSVCQVCSIEISALSEFIGYSIVEKLVITQFICQDPAISEPNCEITFGSKLIND